MNNRVIKNASWIIVSKIIQSLLSLLIGTITARYLGPANYGLINYAASIVAFVVPIMQLGFRNTLVRDIINNPDEEDKIVGTAVFMNFLMSILCILGVTIFVSIFNKGEKETILVCVLFSFNLIFQALEMIQYWFQAKLLSKYTAIISVIAYIVMSIYRIILLCTNKSVYWFAVSQVLDYMIISVLLIVIYKLMYGKKLTISIKKGREMFTISKYYVLSSMMVVFFGYIGNIFLKVLMDVSAVGYYTAAITCAGITNFVFVAIIDSVRPTILESKAKNSSSYEVKMIQLYSIIIVLGTLQSIFVTMFGNLLIKMLYGAEYAPAVIPLKIYCWQIIFSQIGTVRNIWILAEGKQKYLWIINMCGALASTILNYVLISIFGVSGAAVSAVVTQLFTNIVMSYVIKPIRGNNVLLFKGCNPNVLIKLVKAYRR